MALGDLLRNGINPACLAGLPTRPITRSGIALCTLATSQLHLIIPTAVRFNNFVSGHNPTAALFEVDALFGSPLVQGRVVAKPTASWVVINPQIQLSSVADLTQVTGKQIPLATSAQELMGDWRGYRQRNAHTSIAALVGPISTKQHYHLVLGVFPDA
jgi:hypothetical protein